MTKELIQAAREGDNAAWTQIYRELAPALRGFAVARGAKDPDAIVGDVFLVAVEKIDKFKGDVSALRAWMFRITRDRVIDAGRRASSRREFLSDDIATVFAVTGTTTSPATGVSRANPSAEDSAMAKITNEELLSVISRLSALQRDVILLRIVADLSIAQTAEILGKREGAVKILQHRAMKNLKRNFPAEEND